MPDRDSSSDRAKAAAAKNEARNEAYREKQAARDERAKERREQVREQLIERSQPFLEEGEVIQAIFPAQVGMSPGLALVSIFLVAFNRGVLVVATDRSIVILDTGSRASRIPRGVRASRPRSTILGPVTGSLWTRLNLPERTYVHRRYYDEVEAADALAERRPPAEADGVPGPQ